MGKPPFPLGARTHPYNDFQWRNDGMATASSDGGPTGRGPQQFWRLILTFVFVVIEYCIVWFQVQPLMVIFQ